MNHSPSINFDQLSPELIERLKNAFQMIDDDGDGSITEDDLSKIFKSLDINMESKDLKAMLSMNSKDHNISYPEFLTLMSNSINRFPNRSELENALSILSKNKDDRELNIPKDEIINSLKEAGFQDPEGEFQDILKNFSSDKQKANEGDFKGKRFLNTIADE